MTIYLYITEYLGPGALGAYADTHEGTGAFWKLGTLLFGNRFLSIFNVPPDRISGHFRCHFVSISVSFSVPLAYSWESWILKPLSRETHTFTDLRVSII